MSRNNFKRCTDVRERFRDKKPNLMFCIFLPFENTIFEQHLRCRRQWSKVESIWSAHVWWSEKRNRWLRILKWRCGGFERRLLLGIIARLEIMDSHGCLSIALCLRFGSWIEIVLGESNCKLRIKNLLEITNLDLISFVLIDEFEESV